MKSTGVIFQDFSIAGLKKQWEKQQFYSLEKPCLVNEGKICDLRYNACANCYDNYKRWLDANKPKFPGSKTETRRTRGLGRININPSDWVLLGYYDNKIIHYNNKEGEWVMGGIANSYVFKNKSFNDEVAIKCPYGVVGDEIWVKESFARSIIPPDYDYKADNPNSIRKWLSPLFMPKAACRIKLEITNISIERLHDITEEGALREGITIVNRYNGKENVKTFTQRVGDKSYNGLTAHDCYLTLFADMHGKELVNKNPFVWVIQFTVKEFKQ